MVKTGAYASFWCMGKAVMKQKIHLRFIWEAHAAENKAHNPVYGKRQPGIIWNMEINGAGASF